ncbi:unnamed protein product [marine sediment metagenome]|uniref:Uncharacterized protein n=1 Tax=marine sediment metagenome TaxID=412755 RepID=X1HKL4_9ZZZZ
MRAKPIAKSVKVTVNIKPAKLTEVMPIQRAAVKKFWAHLISQVRDEMRAGENPK